MKTEDMNSEQEQIKHKIFGNLIVIRWGTPINLSSIECTKDSDTGENYPKEYKGNVEDYRIIPDI